MRLATKLMLHQSQCGEGEGSGDGEGVGNDASDEDICSEDGQDSSKDTYPTSKTSSARTSSKSSLARQFSFTRSDYNTQPHQPYYQNNNPSRYRSHNRNNRSDWQAGARGSYHPSYQLWASSNSAEEEGVAAAYNEEEETQVYQPHSEPIQEIDPVVTLERICNWLGDILRKPDLAQRLRGARLELGKDESGNNRATFWLAEEDIDPRSFSLEYKSLIRMAFSTEVAPHYKLQLANGQVVVSIE